MDAHQRRAHPVLAVRRSQVPLAPAYAMTAHGAQGRTLEAAIIDLRLGRGVSAIASYVAMTRVKKKRTCSYTVASNARC